MYTFNSELFKFKNTLYVSTFNLNKVKTPKITIPKLKTFKYDKVDNYLVDLYSKVPHHSHR